ncbi:hypothetical protein [Achromobacter ruhlandii]|uniref:hypothetical protein n=1 Tax=Achromobacter ruhlandii TaxID=72557 RepID=UPI0011872FB0|nr:hypothetical protein [Achromobacter ruhlandii]MCZ8436145.1 hypothetical protein [Achromobacter ruhlandii]MDC6086936.1 hypothetical protein [Achromobacter ruhlandii]MDC6151349.1 hypothetical protein [Achromobacter ruhlandii]MDD7978265.1 hypothetical protein [Achromobacter ruhlandii]WIW04408.1 hypothetical protein PPH40_007200 [Achromobacter ruhlandii]
MKAKEKSPSPGLFSFFIGAITRRAGLIKIGRSLRCNNQSAPLSVEIRVFPKHFPKNTAGREPAFCFPFYLLAFISS